ncbi:hypothetical protein IWQ61_008479 [Dispira simplex]|nr:hypothetical protein IWQ61_008479 [Dispira simplex]
MTTTETLTNDPSYGAILQFLGRCQLRLSDATALKDSPVETLKLLHHLHLAKCTLEHMQAQLPPTERQRLTQLHKRRQPFKQQDREWTTLSAAEQCHALLRNLRSQASQYPWLAQRDVTGILDDRPKAVSPKEPFKSESLGVNQGSSSPHELSEKTHLNSVIPNPASTPNPLGTLQEQRRQLFTTADGSILRQRRYAPEPTDPEQSERLVQHHRQIHDELTGDLVHMAQTLKGNSMLFGDLLNKDRQVLQDAQEVISSNVDHMQKHGGRLTTYSRKSWSTTWMTWLIILVVCLTFIMVYFVVRLFPKNR